MAVLTVYYYTLLIQALVERSLRLAMKEEGLAALPLYPEGRPCKAPSTRRLVDSFENIQYHELWVPGRSEPVCFLTKLSTLQRELMRSLGVSEASYRVP